MRLPLRTLDADQMLEQRGQTKTVSARSWPCELFGRVRNQRLFTFLRGRHV